MRNVDVVIERFGLEVGRRSRTLVIKEGGQVMGEVALDRIRSVRLGRRGVSVSTEALAALCEEGVSVVIAEGTGRPVARASSVRGAGGAEVARAQYDAAGGARGVEVAAMLVAEKLRAQASLVRYLSRVGGGDATRVADALDVAVERARALGREVGSIEQVRGALMGVEGSAAREYWAQWAASTKATGWYGRTGRGATDPLNAALNYGYAILEARVHDAVERAGLDARAGFLHADRAGRTSLVFDLMEPWRVLVDDAVGSWSRRARGRLGSTLGEEHRRAVARAVVERLDAPASYKGTPGRVSACMQRSARDLARALVEGGAHEPYGWAVRGPKAPGRLVDPLERVFAFEKKKKGR